MITAGKKKVVLLENHMIFRFFLVFCTLRIEFTWIFHIWFLLNKKKNKKSFASTTTINACNSYINWQASQLNWYWISVMAFNYFFITIIIIILQQVVCFGLLIIHLSLFHRGNFHLYVSATICIQIYSKIYTIVV